MSSTKKEIIALIVQIILTILFYPLLFFWCGWLVGFITKITVGNFLVSALQLIHIDIVKDQIPWLAAALTWIGSFFYQLNIKKDND